LHSTPGDGARFTRSCR